MEKEMKIIPPVGYEIDRENSTFDCIKFKPVKQELTYENVCDKIFEDTGYYISTDDIIESIDSKLSCYITDSNNAPTKEQLEKLLAINQLQNIANYYNGDWKPNWKKMDEYKYFITYHAPLNEYQTNYNRLSNYYVACFKNKEDVQAVIDNPNFREILDKIYKS